MAQTTSRFLQHSALQPLKLMFTSRVNISDVKALRSTCPEFRDSPTLKRKIFHSVRLEASPDGVERCKDTAVLQSLGSTVRRIEFIPWKYSWIMDYEFFRNIFTWQKLLLYFREREDLRDEVSWMFDMGPAEFLNAHFGGHSPVPEAEVRRCFDVYMAQASHSKRLFETQQVEDAWIQVLQALPGVSDFAIGRWHCEDHEQSVQNDMRVSEDEDEMDEEEEMDNEIFFAHGHSYYHASYECYQLQVPVGEAVFSAAISSMKRASSLIKELDISHVTSGDLPWVHNGELDGLNLSGLETLVFRPDIHKIRGLGDDRPDIHAARAITQLVQPCLQTLKRLEIKSEVWPTAASLPQNDTLALLKLEQLSVQCERRLSSLANLIRGSTELQDLSIHFTCWPGGVEYRNLFRAIRHHPHDMRLTANVFTCDGSLGLRKYTAREGQEPCWEGDNIELEPFRSLARYISNQGSWNRHCKGAYGLAPQESHGDDPSSGE